MNINKLIKPRSKQGNGNAPQPRLEKKAVQECAYYKERANFVQIILASNSLEDVIRISRARYNKRLAERQVSYHARAQRVLIRRPIDSQAKAKLMLESLLRRGA